MRIVVGLVVLVLGMVWGAAAQPPVIDISRLDYGGRAPDAPWREAAAERIEQHRKADLEIVVHDAAGKPVEGAEIRAEMTRHAFRFGSQVQVDIIADDSPEADAYRAHFLEVFNFAAINPFYLNRWRSEQQADATLDATLKSIAFFQEHEVPMRGHVLVWRMEEAAQLTPAQVREKTLAHLRRTAGHPVIAAAVQEWDVQNEPTSNSEIFNVLGREAVPDWFRIVHEYAPHAKLFLNEAGIISKLHRDQDEKRIDFIMDLAAYLKAQGTPIHGIGCQSHHVEQLSDINAVLDRLDRLATLGLDIEITEYDIKVVPAVAKGSYIDMWRKPSPTSPDLEEREAEYFRDFLTACFSHPSVTAFVMWGFWDGKHWMYNAPLFREDWTLKPGGKMYRELVYGEWWTRAQGETGEDGAFRTRGFLGDYAITVRHAGQERRVNAKLTKDTGHIVVTLD